MPYKGNSPAIADLLAGQTQLSFATMPTVLPHVKAGKLRAIASIGLARTVALPDVPTVAESGLPGFGQQLDRTVCAGGNATRYRVQAERRSTKGHALA